MATLPFSTRNLTIQGTETEGGNTLSVNSIDANNNTISNLSDPVDDLDPVNKQYCDGTYATQTSVTTNSDNIATNTADIVTNANNISTNTVNILTNTDNISTNNSNIATNTGNIATNTGNIATNTGNIATNTSNISALVDQSKVWGYFYTVTDTINFTTSEELIPLNKTIYASGMSLDTGTSSIVVADTGWYIVEHMVSMFSADAASADQRGVPISYIKVNAIEPQDGTVTYTRAYGYLREYSGEGFYSWAPIRFPIQIAMEDSEIQLYAKLNDKIPDNNLFYSYVSISFKCPLF
jgi:hypothetical protein